MPVGPLLCRLVPIVVSALAATACASAAITTPSQSVATSPSASTSPTPSSTAALPSPADAEEWDAALTITGGDWTVARAAAHGKRGFLALFEQYTSEHSGYELQERGLWASDDGYEWSGVPIPAHATTASSIDLAATADGDYLLVYQVATDEPGIARTHVLISADGAAWDLVETGIPDGVEILGVDSGAHGSVLLTNERGVTRIWHSADGRSWAAVHTIGVDERHGIGAAHLAAGPAGFVIVGSAGTSLTPRWFAAASPDGRAWAERSSPFGPESIGFHYEPGVAAVGSDWIAAIVQPGRVVDFWTSADGLQWEAAGHITDTGERSSWTPVMAEVDGRVLFSPEDGIARAPGSGAWVSTDGIDWVPHDLGADARLSVVLTGSGVALAATADATGSATMWARPAGQ